MIEKVRGSFSAYFLSSAFAVYAGGAVPTRWRPAARGVVETVVGGTASKIGGGKFANGAYSAAFSYMFREAAAAASKDGRCRNCEVSIPEKDRTALSVMFGESVDDIKVIEHSAFAELHGDILATTRENRIYLTVSGADFIADPDLMLHEYYHVIEQWNTGDLTVLKYLWENVTNGNSYWGNRYEVEARQFARDNVWRFESLRRGHND